MLVLLQHRLLRYLVTVFSTMIMAAYAQADIPIPAPKPTAANTPTPATIEKIIAQRTPTQSTPANLATLKAGLDALDQKQAPRALTIRNSLPRNSIERDLLTWSIAVSGVDGIPAAQINDAMAHLTGWPGQTLMEQNFEQALANEAPSSRIVIEQFKGKKPLTPAGIVLLSRALYTSGQKQNAHNLIAPWWHKTVLSASDEKLVLKKAGHLLTRADHLKRMQVMLLNHNITSASRVANLANAQSLYNAFAAVNRNQRQAPQKLQQAQKYWRNSAVLAYANIQYLRRQGQYSKAAQILVKLPTNQATLIDPDAWWSERRVLSREMLDLNKPELAYKIAAGFNGTNPTYAVDAHFHAGWYALRFLKKPTLALQHFSKIPPMSKTPISLSRGYYWMGRASLAAANQQLAHQYFARAAHYGTTFYGQLASAALNQTMLDIVYPSPSNSERSRFENREPVQALSRLIALKEENRAGLFARLLGTELDNKGELALLAVMIEKSNDHYSSLRIGKGAVAQGIDVGALSHPTGAIPHSANISATGKALAYAIARQESEFRPTARSPVGAQGILQLMPATAREVARRNNIGYSSQRLASDVGYNATLGAHFLGEQLNRFDGSYILTFIAYNAGPRRATNWIARYGDPRKMALYNVIDWIERIPFTETRNYVMRVMENYEVYKQRLSGNANIVRDLTNGRQG